MVMQQLVACVTKKTRRTHQTLFLLLEVGSGDETIIPHSALNFAELKIRGYLSTKFSLDKFRGFICPIAVTFALGARVGVGNFC